MATTSRRRRSARDIVAADLEVMPLMNLFIVLIPLLLMSAVFVEVSVIDMNLPSDAQAASQSEPLTLNIHILPDAFVVDGPGLTARSVARQPGAGEAMKRTESKRLGEILATLAADGAAARDVRIVSQSSTRYDDIILVMDEARGAGLPQAALVGAGDGAL